MKVIKRNGEKEIFDPSKIAIAIQKALVEVGVEQSGEIAETLAENIAAEIFAKQEREDIDIEEIQDMVEWDLLRDFPVAGKAYILYRKARQDLWDNGWRMTDLESDIYNSKYRHNNESFKDFLARVGGPNRGIQKAILEKMFVPAGRILAGRGLFEQGRKVSLFNCYVMPPVEDNIESIFDTAKNMARTYSYGGGCGVDITKLRPKGSPVNNAAKFTSGAVSFMDLYSLTTQLIGMEARRGALMISMDARHPDVEEFIGVKNDLSKVTAANISLRVPSDFLYAAANKKSYSTSMEFGPNKEKVERKIFPHELMDKIGESIWRTGEPGILYWDTVNNWHLMSEADGFQFAGVNPCFAGNTKILTKKGYLTIESLIGQEIEIWNGYEWSTVIPQETGQNQPMYKIKFSNGLQLEVTDYHKFILSNRTRVEAKDLVVGDKIIKYDFPVIEGSIEENLYTQGFYSGDGHFNVSKNRPEMWVYSEKIKYCLPFLEYTHSWTDKTGRILITGLNVREKTWVPGPEYSVSSRLSWLAGLLDSDGSYQKEVGFSISSINRKFLEEVSLMLNTLGVASIISIMKTEKQEMLPDGKGGQKLYNCKESYRLSIRKFQVFKKLLPLGLITHRLQEKILNDSEPNRDAGRFIQIRNIEKIENAEKVFCVNEPINHSIVANGIITANCAEEPLIAGGACCLGSINVGAFVDLPFTDKASFNEEKFKRMVELGVVYLNEVVDEGQASHPLQIQKDASRDYRQIGLGLCGLADLFIKMGIVYGSDQSLEMVDKIGFTMIDTALATSALLAAENGPAPMYDDSVLETNFFLMNASPATQELVRQYGLRNTQLLTIPPTGSTATMIGASTGIEPLYQISYQRKTVSINDGEETTYKVFSPVVRELMQAQGIEKEEDLPLYVVTTHDIPVKKRLAIQSKLQDHIDAAISSTINLPEEATPQEIIDAIELGRVYGLKGITFFRDGCERAGILTTEKKKPSKTVWEDRVKTEQVFEKKGGCPKCGGILIHTGGCVECQDCGHSLCSI